MTRAAADSSYVLQSTVNLPPACLVPALNAKEKNEQRPERHHFQQHTYGHAPLQWSISDLAPSSARKRDSKARLSPMRKVSGKEEAKPATIPYPSSPRLATSSTRHVLTAHSTPFAMRRNAHGVRRREGLRLNGLRNRNLRTIRRQDCPHVSGKASGRWRGEGQSRRSKEYRTHSPPHSARVPPLSLNSLLRCLEVIMGLKNMPCVPSSMHHDVDFLAASIM